MTLHIEPDDDLGHGDTPAPPRRLACARCGHGFTVTEGEDALTRKRRREAGMTEEPSGLPDALKALAKVRP